MAEWRLTEAQRALAEQYHDLIYKVLHNHGWSVDVFYDVAAIGLCTAARLYRPERGTTFVSYAGNVIALTVMTEKRTYAKKYIETTELDLRWNVSRDNSDLPEHQAVCKDILAEIEKLPTCYKRPLKLKMTGLSSVEISKITGNTKRSIDQYLHIARSRLKTAIG